ncbi:type II secretion system secretin GspD [Spongiibacter marinus]|uniref:type II secretion system secretin GspD n=1 Tax=Spongiibacter marinus TaxID=354246 RepID=UPI001EF8B459|nr:type II secretion system secretin GspD [Spongiibacter marinus]MBM7424483.1 general secretion pathway protein D [Spongiibacter marinus]
MKTFLLSLSLLVVLAAPLQAAYAERFELDMQNVDIGEFIDTVAKLTGKTIVVDSRVKGKVSVQSHRKLDADELYQIFLLQLGVEGYSAVEAGDGVLKVIPNQAAKIEGIEVQRSSAAVGRSESIITRIAQLQNADSDELVKSLRPLVDNKVGVITSYSDANIILITDRESNVRRLMSIISAVNSVDSQLMETVVLRNSSAEEVERVLNKVLSQQTRKRGSSKPVVAADPRTNTLILFGDDEARSYLRRLVADLDSEVSSQSNIRVKYLKYAKAEELAKVLKSISDTIVKDEQSAGRNAAPGVSSSINIEAHEQTNSIVMSGSPHIISDLEKIIRDLDIRRAQVLVEAIIIEVTDSKAKELGVQWLFRGSQEGSTPAGGINFGGGASGTSGTPGIISLLAGSDAAAAAASTVKGAAIGLGKLSDGFSFATLVSALASDSESNILSTPSLLTLDNEEASILVGQEIPVITGSTASSTNTNPFQTIERQEVGTKLLMTPQINDGDAVQMTIEQEVSSLSPATNAADVITNKRTIKTTVLVNDGATIVLGGLIDDQVNEQTAKVPLLGDIPLLGRLFRADNTSMSKRNLMVFIRPTIVRDQATLSELSGRKYNFIRTEQLAKAASGISLFPFTELSVLPEWSGLEPSPVDLLPRETLAEPPVKASPAADTEPAPQNAPAPQPPAQQGAAASPAEEAPVTAEPIEWRKDECSRRVRAGSKMPRRCDGAEDGQA